MEKCNKLVQYNAMSEPRPCIRTRHKGAGHTPDLTGMRFGYYVVKRQADYQIRPSSGKRLTAWVVDHLGVERTVLAVQLTSGKSNGFRCRHGFAASEDRAVYDTVRNHYRWISNPQDQNHYKYQGMPFCAEWNPSQGGHLEIGIKWILDNLGPKPSSEWSLDVIKHELGFIPGNLRWANSRIQRHNQRHRKLGEYTLEQIEIEARRHGYKLVKI